MRKAFHRIALFAAVILAALSCMREPLPAVPAPKGETIPEGEMPVRIAYSRDADPAGTKASIVGGEESGNWVKDLYMLCFTKEGIYLGHRMASFYAEDGETLTNEKVFSDGCQGRELFSGSVPASTARIHFIANTACNTPEGETNTRIPGEDQIGMSENILMQGRLVTSSTSDRTMIYWGFVGQPTAEAMRDWLAVRTTDDDGNIQYSKKEGSIVHLVRDRARVNFGVNYDFYRATSGQYTLNGTDIVLEDNKIDYKILSISWILSNGLTKAYIAPYNTANSSDHFTSYYNPSADPKLDTGRKTPFDKFTDDETKRYTVTDADDDEMLKVWEYTSDSEPFGKTYDNPLFLFEDPNNTDNPPKIILKVVYQKDKDDASKGTMTKYHTLMMLKDDGSPCDILRNHSYVLNINGLPYEGLGATSLSAAAGSVDYANNRTVTIDDKVTDVTDGDYQLSIIGSTSRIYSDPSLCGTDQYIDFRFEASSSDASISGYDNDSFEVGWTANVLSSFARQDVSVVDFDDQTGKGKIKFTLGDVINSELASGQILLRDKTTNLSRRVNIYTIDKFNFVPEGQEKLKLEAGGIANRTVNGVSCPVYKMKFNLPGKYPVGLYPIYLRMASTTLTPIGCKIGGGEIDESVSVVMESTENGGVMDETTLSGLEYVSELTDGRRTWNYREEGKPWDYWYTYTLMVKLEEEDASGNLVTVTADTPCEMYFADTRGLRAEANRASDIGLYLFIKHFGPAVAVTP